MVCAVGIYAKESDTQVQKLRMSDLALFYINHKDDYDRLRSKYLKGREPLDCVLEGKGRISKKVLALCEQNPMQVLRITLPPSKLGSFGIQHKFTFFENGEGYLIVAPKR